MRSEFWIVAAGLASLVAAARPAVAGGNLVEITRVKGSVEIKSLAPTGKWQPATPGVVSGRYLLRTGPGGSVRLREIGGWVPRRLNRACVDGNSLLRIESFGCGFRVEVLSGRVSAADGKRGAAVFRIAAG